MDPAALATCALLAMHLATPSDCVDPGPLYREDFARTMGVVSQLSPASGCGTYCDLLVTYPDGARYCFVFGATAPTLTRLP